MIRNYRVTQIFLEGNLKGHKHTFVMYSDSRHMYSAGIKVAGGTKLILSVEDIGPYKK